MTAQAETMLETLAALSREFGGPAYVKGGGGNTSAKSASTLWIKPSGTALQEMTPARFVALDRARLGGVYAYSPDPDSAVREREVQELMMAARAPGQTGRPSVESPLHDLLEGTFVVHTHAELVNGLTCSRDGAAVAARLFPEALWVPYIDPGYTLSMDIRSRLATYARRHGAQPAVILLENHGIFVSGSTPEEIRRHYRRVLDALNAAYIQAGIARELSYGAPVSAEKVSALMDLLRSRLGPDAGAVEVSAPFAVVTGPLSPDHMVYAKAYPFTGELTERNVQQFRQQHGYAPRVIATPTGVFGVGRTAKAARLALDLARDGALIQQLAAAFGGARFMSDAARAFIESWEVESYREQQALKPLPSS